MMTSLGASRRGQGKDGMQRSQSLRKTPLILTLDTAETINCANLNVLPVQYFPGKPEQVTGLPRPSRAGPPPLVLPAIRGCERPQQPVVPWRSCFHCREKVVGGKTLGLKKSCQNIDFRSPPTHGYPQRTVSFDRHGKMTRVVAEYIDAGDKSDGGRKVKGKRKDCKKRHPNPESYFNTDRKQSSITLSPSDEEADFADDTDEKCGCRNLNKTQKTKESQTNTEVCEKRCSCHPHRFSGVSKSVEKISNRLEQMCNDSEEFREETDGMFQKCDRIMRALNDYKPPNIGNVYQDVVGTLNRRNESGSVEFPNLNQMFASNSENLITQPKSFTISAVDLSSSSIPSSYGQQGEIWKWMTERAGEYFRNDLNQECQCASQSYPDYCVNGIPEPNMAKVRKLNETTYPLASCIENTADRTRTATIYKQDLDYPNGSKQKEARGLTWKAPQRSDAGVWMQRARSFSRSPMYRTKPTHDTNSFETVLKAKELNAAAVGDFHEVSNSTDSVVYTRPGLKFLETEGSPSTSSMIPMIYSAASLDDLKSVNNAFTPASSVSTIAEFEQFQLQNGCSNGSNHTLSDMYRNWFFKIMSKIHGENSRFQINHGKCNDNIAAEGNVSEEGNCVQPPDANNYRAHEPEKKSSTVAVSSLVEDAGNIDTSTLGSYHAPLRETTMAYHVSNARQKGETEKALQSPKNRTRRHTRNSKSKSYQRLETAYSNSSDSYNVPVPHCKVKNNRLAIPLKVSKEGPKNDPAPHIEELKNSLPRTSEGKYNFKSIEAHALIEKFVKKDLLAKMNRDSLLKKSASLPAEKLCLGSTSGAKNHVDSSEKISTVRNQIEVGKCSKKPVSKLNGRLSKSTPKAVGLKMSNGTTIVSTKASSSHPVQGSRANLLRYQQQSFAAMLKRARGTKTFINPNSIATAFKPMSLPFNYTMGLPPSVRRMGDSTSRLKTNRNAVTVVFGDKHP